MFSAAVVSREERIRMEVMTREWRGTIHNNTLTWPSRGTTQCYKLLATHTGSSYRRPRLGDSDPVSFLTLSVFEGALNLGAGGLGAAGSAPPSVASPSYTVHTNCSLKTVLSLFIMLLLSSSRPHDELHSDSVRRSVACLRFSRVVQTWNSVEIRPWKCQSVKGQDQF